MQCTQKCHYHLKQQDDTLQALRQMRHCGYSYRFHSLSLGLNPATPQLHPLSWWEMLPGTFWKCSLRAPSALFIALPLGAFKLPRTKLVSSHGFWNTQNSETSMRRSGRKGKVLFWRDGGAERRGALGATLPRERLQTATMPQETVGPKLEKFS